MILFPAIDLKDGQCVRLKLGDMRQATVYNADPAAQAKAFEEQGFEWLHVVDLNGAFAGKSVNGAAVDAILEATKNPVQLGGGIRTLAHIEAWLDKGLARVILGTVAVRDPGAGQGGLPALSRQASPSASTPRAARLRSRVGRKPRRSASSSWHGNSKAPAWRRSSTPTSIATACCGHQLGIDDRACRRRLDPGHRLRRARLDRRHRRA